MLVENMTPLEVGAEIMKDWPFAITCWDRLCNDYDKLRRKGNVNKSSTYPIAFPIKTSKRNNWIFILSKAPSDESYRGASSINICSLTYYFNTKGLRVFKIMPTGGLNVFNGHLFQRYNERMELNLIEPMEVVKQFFMNNGYFTSKIIKKDDRDFTITVCRDGLLLGEMQENGTWLVNKTFITKDQKFLFQDEIEAAEAA